ncbi:MAG TPA: gliding motility-associated C-terminal domain-containing protein [Sphingobacteriaceae bacterium]|nr:gliding motility-associated C-terminal domain-containing protein [Sphingobacteriaceae bacterium]
MHANGSVVVINDIYPAEDQPATLLSREIPLNPDIKPDPMISPNGDDKGNEFFNIENIISFTDNEVVIFNRWGNGLFRIKGYNESDRVFKGFANKGMIVNMSSPLPEGVYYYLITTNRTVNGQVITALNKGYIILKR